MIMNISANDVVFSNYPKTDEEAVVRFDGLVSDITSMLRAWPDYAWSAEKDTFGRDEKELAADHIQTLAYWCEGIANRFAIRDETDVATAHRLAFALIADEWPSWAFGHVACSRLRKAGYSLIDATVSIQRRLGTLPPTKESVLDESDPDYEAKEEASLIELSRMGIDVSGMLNERRRRG